MSADDIFSPRPEVFEKRSLKGSLVATIILHLLILSLMIMSKPVETSTNSMPSIVADFIYYDPEGGSGGASDNDLIMEETLLPSQAEILPQEEIVKEPEPEPEIEETTALIESVSPKAATEPKKPPLKAKKNKEKSNKPPQTAQNYRAGSANALGDSPTAGGNSGSGRGGVGGGSGRGNPNLLNAYISQIQRKLNRYKKYPPEAKSQGLGGQVKVNFSVNRQGQVIASRLVSSSGNRALDNEVLALLKRISPVPAIPAGLNSDRLNLTIPVVFSLH
ncbi:MAG: energy transducer TonB [Deltaproteobacteria bacterium]|jgi:TonB family protein|nr:energy transducer TonB [Deltaproteobacteria bacterium]